MDLVMPGRDGVSAMQELKGRASRSRVIVLTSFLEDDRLLPALEAGAAGYLLKNSQPSELARAVRAAYAGEAIIDPTAAGRLGRAPSGQEPQRRGAARAAAGAAGRRRAGV